MPFKGFTGVTNITGIEEFISMSITGEMTELVIDPGTANNTPSVVTYYNPRYNITVEGIYDGSPVPSTFSVGGNTYTKTSDTITRTAGDVQKVSITGVYNPGSSLG